MARALGEGVYQAIRTATRRLVRATGGIDGGAATTRVARSTLAMYYDPFPESRGAARTFMPVDVAADLEDACGEPILSRALAAITGHVLVRVDARKGDPLARDFARIGKEAGELFAAYSTALADDGKVSAREARRLIAETDDLVAAVMSARGDLLAKLDDGDV